MTGQGAHIPVSETFYSIQGEGKLTGVPSTFIRTSGCNLRCAWCDTPYASWKPEGAPQSIHDLVELARRGAGHTVVTGGEPMMFPALSELTDMLARAGQHITIETAGTMHRTDIRCDLMSISPKLANSTPLAGDPRDPAGTWRLRHEERRINVPALQGLLDGPWDRQLKFVVRTPEDLPEIDALLAQLKGWSTQDILLMPEGVVTPTQAAKDAVVCACLARGWRYCTRLHIELFGNRRGT
ncbi:MAG TPA: 7-carboxy-7-deazaguanine synthase QueE [Phycisphaerales bacterium]|nr:7-carboxy-7-deazaguanine synthase QueE [Phycisphaerales bacterium]